MLRSIRDEHEIVAKIERWRELYEAQEHLPRRAADPDRPADGRLHTTFNQIRAATGRLSSTNPNLQNIPIRTELGRAIRGCFVAEPGKSLISADYSQVELRVLAHVAGDETLREIFRRGEDVHSGHRGAASSALIPTADLGPATRSKAKMVNFGIVYGLSAFGLADRLKIPQDEAAEFIDRYLERFPGVKQFIDETIERRPSDGYVTTLIGRRRLIPELRSRNRPDPAAGRAPGRQHRDPGHRGRHHQDGDDRCPRGARGSRPARPGSSCRSTTSCSSKAPRPRPKRSASSPAARWSPPTTSTRPWRWRRE